MIKILVPTTKQRRERMHQFIASCSDNAGMEHQIVVFENALGGYVKAIRTLAATCSPTDIIMAANDDISFGKDWLKILYTALINAFPDGYGMAMGDDGIHGDKHATLPLVRADMFLQTCHGGYWHNFCDWEWYHIAKARGKFIYVPEAKTIHEHWSNNKAERDETYLLQVPYFETDKDLFWERYALSDGFKNWESLEGYAD